MKSASGLPNAPRPYSGWRRRACQLAEVRYKVFGSLRASSSTVNGPPLAQRTGCSPQLFVELRVCADLLAGQNSGEQVVAHVLTPWETGTSPYCTVHTPPLQLADDFVVELAIRNLRASRFQCTLGELPRTWQRSTSRADICRMQWAPNLPSWHTVFTPCEIELQLAGAPRKDIRVPL